MLEVRRRFLVGRERWVLLKIPRGDIDGVGEGKYRNFKASQTERQRKTETKKDRRYYGQYGNGKP